MNESQARLDRRKKKGVQDVTEVKLLADATEAKRRVGKLCFILHLLGFPHNHGVVIEDERMKKYRLSRLQNEAIGSSLANQNVEKKWVELLAKDIPGELDREIRSQQEECRKIIQSKDELIAEFQKQLRMKDEEYVTSLRKQVRDLYHL